jgi:hypothetical protein
MAGTSPAMTKTNRFQGFGDGLKIAGRFFGQGGEVTPP